MDEATRLYLAMAIIIGLGVAAAVALIILGRRSATRPIRNPILRSVYYGCRGLLIALGVYILIGLGIQSLSRGELGIGVAFLVYLAFEGISFIVKRFPFRPSH